MTRLRKVLWIAIGAFCAFAAAGWAVTEALNRIEPTVQSSGVATIGGPFELVNQNGSPVTENSLKGKPSVLYFGYTYCPDACPTTLADMTRWIGMLRSDADRINFVFVTVDPARDTPHVMKSYLASFDPRIQGFTGTQAQIAKVAKAYRVYYKKEPGQGGNYLMDHTSVIYLMDAAGAFSGIIPYQDKDADAVAKLRALLSPQS